VRGFGDSKGVQLCVVQQAGTDRGGTGFPTTRTAPGKVASSAWHASRNSRTYPQLQWHTQASTHPRTHVVVCDTPTNTHTRAHVHTWSSVTDARQRPHNVPHTHSTQVERGHTGRKLRVHSLTRPKTGMGSGTVTASPALPLPFLTTGTHSPCAVLNVHFQLTAPKDASVRKVGTGWEQETRARGKTFGPMAAFEEKRAQ
jgi:hypothetical protein